MVTVFLGALGYVATVWTYNPVWAR
jgi:hypothetical protein